MSTGGLEGVGDDAQGCGDVVGGDHETGDGADGVRAEGEHADSGGVQGRGELGSGSGGDFEEDDVRGDGGGIDGDAGEGGEAEGEGAGIGVIVGESCAVMFEGVECGGGEDAGLAHAAAEHFAEAAGALDDVARAAEGGADGCAEAFGEADADGVEWGGVFEFGDAGGGRGVPEPSAVEVEFEAVVSGDGFDFPELSDGPDGAAAAVVGIFDADDLGGREVLIGRAESGLEVCCGEDSADAGETAAGETGQCSGAACFVVVDVGVGVDEDLVAGVCEGAEGELIGHGARGSEEGGFLAEQFGDTSFEEFDGGVVAEDIVADGGGGHDGPHGLGGLRDGVAAEINRHGEGRRGRLGRR